MLLQNYTRIYLDTEAANAADPVLALVPAERRATLIAKRAPGDNAVYHFDIHLQGDDETVFFDVKIRGYSITACSGPAACLRSATLVEPIMIASGMRP